MFFAHRLAANIVGWGLRGKFGRVTERTLEAIVPESVLIAVGAMRRHKKRLGVYPNLLHPKTFNEKLLRRMVLDRRPILTRLADKHAVRDYVRERIGEHVLPRVYWVTQTPADIPFDDLPERFVVKATHGSFLTYLVPDKAVMNKADLLDKCASWLRGNHYDVFREWAYKQIAPRIMVEEFISDGTGLVPLNYKLFVFHGKVHLIRVQAGFVDLRMDHYTPSWNRLDMKTWYKTIERPVPRPPHLDELIRCAEVLGDGLNFVRVDLYDAGKPYFGEMTVYPGGGLAVIDPKWNRYLGGLWDSPSERARSRTPRDAAVAE